MVKWIFYSVGFFLIATLIVAILKYAYFLPSRTISDHYVRVGQFPKLLALAQALPNTGYIETNNNHVNILKVSNDFIEKLYPELEFALNTEEKKCLHRSSNKAHITLEGYLGLPKSSLLAGRQYRFRVNGIFKERRIRKIRSYQIEETWYEAAVESPQLLQSFNEIIHPEILHISFAVSAKIMGSSLCFEK